MSLKAGDRIGLNTKDRGKKERLAIAVHSAARSDAPRLDYCDTTNIPDFAFASKRPYCEEALNDKDVELQPRPWWIAEGKDVAITCSGTCHLFGQRRLIKNLRLDARLFKELQPRHRYRLGKQESAAELWTAYRKEFHKHKTPWAWVFEEGSLAVYTRPIEYVVARGAVTNRRTWDTPGAPSFGTRPERIRK